MHAVRGQPCPPSPAPARAALPYPPPTTTRDRIWHPPHQAPTHLRIRSAARSQARAPRTSGQNPPSSRWAYSAERACRRATSLASASHTCVHVQLRTAAEGPRGNHESLGPSPWHSHRVEPCNNMDGGAICSVPTTRRGFLHGVFVSHGLTDCRSSMNSRPSVWCTSAACTREQLGELR